jgi:cytokinin riboside 5'-monophosphate phosphoribohydrolase
MPTLPPVARHVCVYCSSSASIDPAHSASARHLGRALADRGDVLVWGGASVGTMGQLARAAQDAGGRVVGVIPQSLVDVEIAYVDADELVVTADLRDRKAEMEARADAFVVLPGGFGTLEELMEQLTLRLLGVHDKPIVLVDVHGFWQPLLALFERLYEDRFARPESRAAYAVAADVDEALALLDGQASAELPRKWL